MLSQSRRRSDAVLWVAQAGVVTRPQLARAAELIERNGMPVIGFVVNRIDSRSADYRYGYGYEYLGSYYGEKNQMTHKFRSCMAYHGRASDFACGSRRCPDWHAADAMPRTATHLRLRAQSRSNAAAAMRGSGLMVVPQDFAKLTAGSWISVGLNVLDDPDFAGSFRIDQQGNIDAAHSGNNACRRRDCL